MKYIITVTLFFFSIVAFSQNDCVDAIIVCGNSGYQDLTAIGVGSQELSGSNSCSSQENNSLWFKININSGGTLGFVLTPTNVDGSINTNIAIDFDFFIFGPNVNCGNIGRAIRCSTTNPEAANQGNNLTGMDSSSSEQSEGPGAGGNSFVRWLNVNNGDSYFIVIDRPIGTSNFKIDWTGSATFNEPPILNNPPTGASYDIEESDGDGVFDSSTEFDLTVNTPFLIGTQSDVSVSYHVNNNDAQTGNNSIDNALNYTNISDPQTIFARIKSDDTECFIVTQFLIGINDVILDYPKFLTPNNDGHNDTWKLIEVESINFAISPIQIFDRFGKVVAILDPNSQGWDGYYNGKQLPASDYWFKVQLTDSEGATLDKEGHFSLIRR